MTLLEIKRQLRAGKYAWPGGYPLFFNTSDGSALCFDCMRKEWRNICEAHIIPGYRDSGWHCDAVDVNWEDPGLLCDHCGTRIESAYAEHENREREPEINTGTPEVSRASHCS